MIVSVVKLSTLSYTPSGIQRFKNVVQATLQERRWTARQLATHVQRRIAQINEELRQQGRPAIGTQGSFTTVNRHVSSNIQITRLNEEVVEAMAPFVYRVLSMNGDEIVLDTSLTYADNWVELARLATDDFTFEDGYPTRDMKQPRETPLSRFIKYWTEKQNPPVSLQEFELRLLQVSNMTPERFQAIASGAVPPEDVKNFELLFLTGVMHDEQNHPYPIEYMQGINAGVIDPTYDEGNSKPNGAHIST